MHHLSGVPASFKLSILGVRHPSRMPSLLYCYIAQPDDFEIVNCADVALSVFYSPVLTRCRIFFQL